MERLEVGADGTCECRFQLIDAGDTLTFAGRDDLGDPFFFSLDRLWVANLALDLERWLCGVPASPVKVNGHA